MSVLLAVAGLLALSPVATDPERRDDPDRRDEVVLEDGEVRRGRVLERHGPGPVVLDDDGKRVEFEADEVAATTTVTDRVGALLELRRPGSTPERLFALAEEAQRVELPALARLFAWEVLLQEPQHDGANALLGHERKRSGWRWTFGLEDLEPAEFLAETRGRGLPLEIESEHYRLRTDAGLERAVPLLFDLERGLVEWYREFGDGSWAREQVELLDWTVVADREELSPITSERHPYFAPGEGGVTAGTVHAFFEAGVDRPRRTFDLQCQQLLYSAVGADQVAPGPTGDPWRRVVAWLEVGLGAWFDAALEGPPGHAAWVGWRPDVAMLRAALRPATSRVLALGRNELTNLIHLGYADLYMPHEEAPMHRAKVRGFVAYLMDPSVVLRVGGEDLGPAREALSSALRRGLGRATGDSSSELDEALGTEVEDLLSDYRAWLRQF